ncbi:DUF805 domain-containing protein [Kutzneria sp. NPDC052558]|uniref:DUF805 domain-containing protein n=1 Tax=Kutzneria sp. NPDC052558 TaxID=3364121 RepID=UPI0037CAB856
MISYLNALRHYAVFHGRARRAEFWMFMLVHVVISTALAALVKTSLPYTIYSLAVALPMLALAARRLHDTGRSAWWLLIGVLPVIGQIVLIVLFATRSDEGANRFGPSPMAVTAR